MTVALAADLRAEPARELVLRRLHAARTRWWVRTFTWSLAIMLPICACLALEWGVACFFLGWPVIGITTAIIVLILPVALALYFTFGLNASVRSLGQAAHGTDHFARTHDRFQTAWTLAQREPAARTPVENLALAECVKFIERFDLRTGIPVRFSRAILYSIFPLISLGMLAWFVALGIGQPPHDATLNAAIERRADSLAKIATALRPPNPANKTPDLDKIAAAMKQSAERLKQTERASDDERLKSALKELSSLEAMLNAMKQNKENPAKISPSELAALAAALAATEGGRDTAEALNQGQLEKAAAQLEKLLEQLKQQGNSSEALQQLAKSLQEQSAKLTEQEKNELAQQMEQAAQGAQSGQPQLSQQALQRLADLLRRAGKSGAGKSGSAQASNSKNGQPMTEKQLQDLINALENMKDGLQPGGGDQPGRSDAPGEGGQSLALVESFGKNPATDPQAGKGASGQPGTEHDEGHPDNIFGEKPIDAAKQGEAHRVEGLLGNGESLQQLTAAGGGGPARASRGYRDLYNAMAPAAQNTVEQENIPLGSRFYIRRYFENIRPSE